VLNCLHLYALNIKVFNCCEISDISDDLYAVNIFHSKNIAIITLGINIGLIWLGVCSQKHMEGKNCIIFKILYLPAFSLNG